MEPAPRPSPIDRPNRLPLGDGHALMATDAEVDQLVFDLGIALQQQGIDASHERAPLVARFVLIRRMTVNPIGFAVERKR